MKRRVRRRDNLAYFLANGILKRLASKEYVQHLEVCYALGLRTLENQHKVIKRSSQNA